MKDVPMSLACNHHHRRHTGFLVTCSCGPALLGCPTTAAGLQLPAYRHKHPLTAPSNHCWPELCLCAAPRRSKAPTGVLYSAQNWHEIGEFVLPSAAQSLPSTAPHATAPPTESKPAANEASAGANGAHPQAAAQPAASLQVRTRCTCTAGPQNLKQRRQQVWQSCAAEDVLH